MGRAPQHTRGNKCLEQSLFGGYKFSIASFTDKEFDKDGCRFSDRYLLAGLQHGVVTMEQNGPGGDGAQSAQAAAAQAAAAQAAQAQAAGAFQDQVDRIVRQRLEQALGNVFTKVLSATERAAQAAEAQASASKTDGLVKAMKVEAWKPATREEELKTWRDWYFQLTTWLIANDNGYEDELGQIDPDSPVDHDLLEDESVQRSQKLYGLLCSLLKGRPLLLIRSLEKEKAGYEALRILKREMEPKERARSLAIIKQLASCQFKEGTGLHKQLVAYEEALRSYEASSGNSFPDDLMVATVVTGLKEPLRSQVQLRMRSSTTYSDIREWILQYENVNAPWSSSLAQKGATATTGSGPQPMDVDQVQAWKGKHGKHGKDKGKGGKQGKDKKGKQQHQWQGGKQQHQLHGGKQQQHGKGKHQQSYSWGKGKGHDASSSSGKGYGGGWEPQKGKKGKAYGACNACGQYGHWKNECPSTHSLSLGNRWRPLRQCQPVPLLTGHQAQCRGLKLFRRQLCLPPRAAGRHLSLTSLRLIATLVTWMISACLA